MGIFFFLRLSMTHFPRTDCGAMPPQFYRPWDGPRGSCSGTYSWTKSWRL